MIDGLNELKSVIIGKNSFSLSNATRKGNKCLIMNCNELSEIHIGEKSFFDYESFELKNLPSLISIQLDDAVLFRCHSIVFESMKDWMNDEWDLTQLQSITLGYGALFSDNNTKETNELIMKSMYDNDDWLIRSPFTVSNQRR